jgi:hypothetical protein
MYDEPKKTRPTSRLSLFFETLKASITITSASPLKGCDWANFVDNKNSSVPSLEGLFAQN